MRRRKIWAEVSRDGSEILIHIPVHVHFEEIARAARRRTPEILKLTLRERAIMEAIRKTFAYKIIASDLNISVRTVKFHARSIYSKLGVRDRWEFLRAYGYAK